jgi:transcriptional regulator with XRE-family HTH domain
MGRGTRPRPKRLSNKLRQVREALGLSQNGLIRRLGFSRQLTQDYISAYERGVREPPLPVLLAYARAAGVWVDVLVDDALDLPEHLPASPTHEGRPSKSARPAR